MPSGHEIWESEFLRTLILSLVAMTHPDPGESPAHRLQRWFNLLGMKELPHTAAVVTNMAGSRGSSAGWAKVLTGELDRRQSILRRAGMKVGAAGPCPAWPNTKYRERGADTAANAFRRRRRGSPKLLQSRGPSSGCSTSLRAVMRMHLLLAAVAADRRCSHR